MKLLPALLILVVPGAIFLTADAQHNGHFQFFRGFGNTFKPVQHMFHHASATAYFATFLYD